MKARDPFADHVDALCASVPIFPIVIAFACIIECCYIVSERVEPHVVNLIGISRHPNAPAVGPSLRSRNGNIVEPVGEQGQRLLLARSRFDAEAAGVDERSKLLLITRKAEEPVLFLDELEGSLVLRAALSLGEERLAPPAVESSIETSVHITHARAGPPKLVHTGTVPRVGAGAQKIIE